jgi:hypothetical protein
MRITHNRALNYQNKGKKSRKKKKKDGDEDAERRERNNVNSYKAESQLRINNLPSKHLQY